MTETTPTLTRAANGRAAAPVRIVHLGVGNFFRAHQAWYTEHAADAAEWGIAAFTGRSAAIADALRPQDGLYTLITRTAEGDEFEVISSLSAVHAADEYEALLGYFRSPELAIVTLTVTEAGYRRRADGSLDQNDPAVAADLAFRNRLQAAYRLSLGRELFAFGRPIFHLLMPLGLQPVGSPTGLRLARVHP